MQDYIFYSSQYLNHYFKNIKFNEIQTQVPYQCLGDCQGTEQQQTAHLLSYNSLKNIYLDLEQEYSTLEKNQLFYLFSYLILKFSQQKYLVTGSHTKYINKYGNSLNLSQNKKCYRKQILTISKQIYKDIEAEKLVANYAKLSLKNYPAHDIALYISKEEHLAYNKALELAEKVLLFKDQNLVQKNLNEEGRLLNFYMQYRVSPDDSFRILSQKPNDLVLNKESYQHHHIFTCTQECRNENCPFLKNRKSP